MFDADQGHRDGIAGCFLAPLLTLPAGASACTLCGAGSYYNSTGTCGVTESVYEGVDVRERENSWTRRGTSINKRVQTRIFVQAIERALQGRCIFVLAKTKEGTLSTLEDIA